MTTDPTAPSAEAIEAAARAAEPGAFLPHNLRDLPWMAEGARRTAERGLTAALPLLSAPEADEVERLREALEAVAQVERVRALCDEADELVRMHDAMKSMPIDHRPCETHARGKFAGRIRAILDSTPAARTPDDDAEGKS